MNNCSHWFWRSKKFNIKIDQKCYQALALLEHNGSNGRNDMEDYSIVWSATSKMLIVETLMKEAKQVDLETDEFDHGDL